MSEHREPIESAISHEIGDYSPLEPSLLKVDFAQPETIANAFQIARASQSGRNQVIRMPLVSIDTSTFPDTVFKHINSANLSLIENRAKHTLQVDGYLKFSEPSENRLLSTHQSGVLEELEQVIENRTLLKSRVTYRKSWLKNILLDHADLSPRMTIQQQQDHLAPIRTSYRQTNSGGLFTLQSEINDEPEFQNLYRSAHVFAAMGHVAAYTTFSSWPEKFTPQPQTLHVGPKL